MASRNDLLSQDFVGKAEEIIPADDFTRRSNSLDDRSSALMDSSDDDDDDSDDIDIENVDGDDTYNELIDIKEPLGQLKGSLEAKLGYSLKDYEFWLQETQMLSDEMTLVDQCIQGEGLVQIKVEVSNGKINIVDVLKPEEDLFTDVKPDRHHRLSSMGISSNPTKWVKVKKEKVPAAMKTENQEKQAADNVTRWVISSAYRKQQERLNFPTDPLTWNRLHVAHWLGWVQEEFPDSQIDRNDWEINGRELCALSHNEFKKKVPFDPGDTLWTHLELLRKHKFVAVIQRGARLAVTESSAGSDSEQVLSASRVGGPLERKTLKRPPARLGVAKFPPGNRTGNNGQVQLWQFLLELLTDKEYCEVIYWVGDEGEFKIESPKIVADLWGIRKNKPNMNYEKLSRALRYYYDGDMIGKVEGKRFAYKFVCNLKEIIGYDASELSRLVREAHTKSMGSISVYRY